MRNSLYILFLGAMLVLLNACSDNTSLPSSETPDAELATVHLRVSTRANDGADSNMDANEGIKALRVIVLNADWKILENWYQEGLGGTDGQTEEQTVTLKLPRTKVRFLAIANEKSMGRSFDTASLMEDEGLNDYNTYGLKEIFNRAWDDASPAFPKTAAEIAENGLPMTGVKGANDVSLNPDGNVAQDYNEILYQDTSEAIDLSNVTSVDIEIPLVRCVSKIVVRVTNAMDRGLNVQTVKFGWFFANKVYYYAHNPLHLPYNSTLSIWEIDNVDQTVAAGEKEKTIFTGYFYPVELANDDPNYNYLIALETELATNEYRPFLKKDDPSGTTKIGRNMLVNVNCTVNLQGSLEVNAQWELVVQHWDVKDNMSVEFD